MGIRAGYFVFAFILRDFISKFDDIKKYLLITSKIQLLVQTTVLKDRIA